MKVRLYRVFISFAICNLVLGKVQAQELNERLEVQGKYEYEKLPVNRLDRLPEFKYFQVGDNKLAYTTQGVPAEFVPSSPDAVATVWGGRRSDFNPRGYLNLSLGSWLNSDLSAGYSIIRKDNEHLGIRLQHNSTSLWHPDGNDSPKRFSYQERIGADYYKDFAHLGSLSASLQYHLGYFNYYGCNPAWRIPNTPRPAEKYTQADPECPTQTLNDVAARVEWLSNRNEEAKNIWNIALGTRYYCYRTATRELDIILDGGFAHVWNKGKSINQIGIDLRGDYFNYTSAPHIVNPHSYGALFLTPFYRWQKKNLTFRAGADLDLTFNASGLDKDSHYGAFHAAPDVRFDVSGKKMNFYIHLLGGTELHTLASTSQLDPYRNPQLLSTLPTYTPFDGNLGVEISPFSGFKAKLNLQFKVTRNVWAGGWYTVYLNYAHLGELLYPEIEDYSDFEFDEGYERYNLAGFGVDVDLKYDYGDVFSVMFAGQYSPQGDKRGIFNGLDRPRWILNAGLSGSPLKSLTLGLNYQYRGVRVVYPGLRLKDINRIDFKASWKFNQHFSIYFKVDNLLNQNVWILPCLKGEGIVFAGGLQWLF